MFTIKGVHTTTIVLFVGGEFIPADMPDSLKARGLRDKPFDKVGGERSVSSLIDSRLIQDKTDANLK
jgi:hypothetical protein